MVMTRLLVNYFLVIKGSVPASSQIYLKKMYSILPIFFAMHHFNKLGSHWIHLDQYYTRYFLKYILVNTRLIIITLCQ